MKETTEYLTNVVGIVNAAREFNPRIGNRIRHYYNEQGKIVVFLTNNAKITIGLSYAQDGAHTMSKEELKKVAESYILL